MSDSTLFTGSDGTTEYLLTQWDSDEFDLATRPAGSGATWSAPDPVTPAEFPVAIQAAFDARDIGTIVTAIARSWSRCADCKVLARTVGVPCTTHATKGSDA